MESLGHLATQPGGRDQTPERLAAGAAAGDYVIERFLGAGAMGDVYAGRHPVINKRVAIKVLKRELAASPESAERFVREAQAVNQIDHENVVDIFGFGRLADGRHYLAMALIDGVSLRARLAEPLAVADALDILGAVAAALDAAHARGVVHRDLKPDNVMLGAGNKVSVLDFGIAKLVASAEGTENVMTLTGQGAWLGTPAYMAPEQWSADGAGPASDRYALGVMAFELLAGKLPFAAPNLPAMMEQHFRAPVPALSTRGAIAERAIFDPILQRALAKDPDARFPTGAALVEALRATAGGKRFARTQRRSYAPAAIGAGVLGVSIIGVLAVRGSGDASPAPDTARVAVDSVPSGAEVVVDGEHVGKTPRAIELTTDKPHAIELRKPGYLPVAIARAVGATGGTLEVPLATVSGFDGVWQLPDGKLRRFQRTADRVDVYERDAIAGSDGASHTYAFGETPKGVAFTATEMIADERSPDPSCRIAHRVEYHYEGDALTVALERVGVAFDGTHCVVASSQPGTPVALHRVDKVDLGEVRYSTAPIGTPPEKPRIRKTPIVAKRPPPPPSQVPQPPIPNDTMDNRLDTLQKGNNEVMPQAPNQAPSETQAVPQLQQQQQAPAQPPQQRQKK